MYRGLRGLWSYLFKYWRPVLAGMIFLMLSDAGQLYIPLIIRRVIDGLTAHEASSDWLRHECMVLFAFILGIVLARFCWRHFLFSAARRAELHLRERLLERVLSLPASFLARTPTGDVMALATNDLLAVRMALAMGMVALFDSTVLGAAALIMMASLDWRLMLWTAVPFPFLAVVMTLSLRLIYGRFDEVQASFERLTEKTRESIAGMRVLRAYVQAEGDAADFDRYSRDYYERSMSYVRVDSLFQPSIMLLAGLSTAILLGIGGGEVVRGQTTLGNFTAFSSYLALLTWPMIAAGWMLTLIQRGAASMARLLDMLERPEMDDSVPPVNGTSRAAGELEARQLTFRYNPEAPPALHELSFKVAAGGTLGLVGEVGSGKSTLALLLSRIYEPPAGTLFLDGRDVNSYPLAWLRSQVSWVPQESFLFSDTIAENLRLGSAEAGDEQLADISRFAAIHDEILEFPEGYETMLGERGVTLSGGQKQRLSLARALLKSAPILVLDDTMSAVDAEAERRILDHLRERVAGRTTVVISHRISAVRDLDWIIVLRGGQVAQQGRHADLLAVEGYYRELYELQELER
jgi:ATP-binding cassette subfamily B protein